jgi:hypothetical protein
MKFIDCTGSGRPIAKGGAMHRRSLRTIAVFLMSTCPAISFSQVLDVPEVTQEQDQWCWAAVSSCVLTYYGTPVSQCAIADYTRTHATWHDFGAVNCCEDPKKKCNYWNYNWGSEGSIQAILENWGVKNTGTAKSLTIAKMQGELGGGRPFIIRWAYPDGGGHFIVGHGIADSSVYYMNPWFGEGLKIAKYKWMLSTSGHTWAETNVMTTSPAVLGPVALVSPRDSSRTTSRSQTFIWRKAGGASYRFQCATAASFAAPVKDTTVKRDTTLLLSGLLPSTVYFWHVCATDSATTGAWSATWRFTTEPSTSVAAVEKKGPAVQGGAPAGGGLTVTYAVAFAAYVEVGIYSLRGELLRMVCSGFHRPGAYSKQVPGGAMSSGNYLLSVRAGGSRTTSVLLYDGGR